MARSAGLRSGRRARGSVQLAGQQHARDPRYIRAVADARALYKEGFEHFTNGRIDEAIASYRGAVEADPSLAIAWNGLSLAYKHIGDLAAAIEAGRVLIELEPDDPLSHTNLSILYQNQGLIQEAEDEKALALQLQMKAQGRS